MYVKKILSLSTQFTFHTKTTKKYACFANTQGLKDTNSQSAIELLMSKPTLLESLRKAHQGSYGNILSLLGCLDHGLRAKKLVDKVIDASTFVFFLPRGDGGYG